jgi:hypothetical protein
MTAQIQSFAQKCVQTYIWQAGLNGRSSLQFHSTFFPSAAFSLSLSFSLFLASLFSARPIRPEICDFFCEWAIGGKMRKRARMPSTAIERARKVNSDSECSGGSSRASFLSHKSHKEEVGDSIRVARGGSNTIIRDFFRYFF